MRYFIFLLLALIPFYVRAGENDILVITDLQDNNYVVNLDDDPTLSFDQDCLIVMTASESVAFPVSNLKSYAFSQSNSVDEVLIENSCLYMEKKGNLITLKNLPENLLIQVVNINGVSIDSFKVPAERALSFSIENYQKGVYFLRVGKLTAKFIK